jgi:hypothetical protein
MRLINKNELKKVKAKDYSRYQNSNICISENFAYTALSFTGLGKNFLSRLTYITPFILKAINTKVKNDLNQLKAAIDHNAHFMHIIKIVHIHLLPNLITAYNLKIENF